MALESRRNANVDHSETRTDNAGVFFAPGSAASTRALASVDGTLNGELFALPAGVVDMTLRAAASADHLDNDQEPNFVTPPPGSTSRTTGTAGVSLDVPIAHRGRALGALGNLTINGNAQVDELSDFGMLTRIGAGANWSPAARLNLLASWNREEQAPTVRQLGDPFVQTPGTRIFDFTTGVVPRVAVVTGGNPDLRTERRNILDISGSWQPFDTIDFKLRADYARVSIDRPISDLTVSPILEAAFPERFLRGPTGNLLSVDLRPVNFDRAGRNTLQVGFDFTKPLRSRRVSASEIEKILAGARSAGIDVPKAAAASPNRAGAPSVPAVGYNGRLTFSLTDTITLVDRAVVRSDLPELDYLYDSAIGQTGGQPRHQVQAQAGWSNHGVGARIGANWRSATNVKTITGDMLHFSPVATFDLRCSPMSANTSRSSPSIRGSPEAPSGSRSATSSTRSRRCETRRATFRSATHRKCSTRSAARSCSASASNSCPRAIIGSSCRRFEQRHFLDRNASEEVFANSPKFALAPRDDVSSARSGHAKFARRRGRPPSEGGRDVRSRSPAVRVQARRGADDRADGSVRAHDRRDNRRGLEGNVFVRGPRRQIDHPSARVHRRNLPRLSQRRMAAVCAVQGRDPRLGLPLRTAAEGPLPRVPSARCRDHRRGRAAGGCRVAWPCRPTTEGARDRGRNPAAEHARAIRRPEPPGGMRSTSISASHASALSEDSQARLERNPLRILDSKAHEDWPIVDAPRSIDEFLTAGGRGFLRSGHRRPRLPPDQWERAPRLVRGLDYYRHTAFEFVTDRLGAQGTVLAGGRYDGLIEALGGPHTPAVGWAAGIERLAMMIAAPEPERPSGRHCAAWPARRGGGAGELSLDFVAKASRRRWPIAAT